MSKKFISEEDAKKAVGLLSEAFQFAVFTTCKTCAERVGAKALATNVEWTTVLRWPGGDLLYLRTKAGKHEQVVCVTRDEGSAFPQMLEELSGAKLCTYRPYELTRDGMYRNDGNERGFEVISEIPKFSSLSELKMKLAIKGLV